MDVASDRARNSAKIMDTARGMIPRSSYFSAPPVMVKLRPKTLEVASSREEGGGGRGQSLVRDSTTGEKKAPRHREARSLARSLVGDSRLDGERRTLPCLASCRCPFGRRPANHSISAFRSPYLRLRFQYPIRVRSSRESSNVARRRVYGRLSRTRSTVPSREPRHTGPHPLSNTTRGNPRSIYWTPPACEYGRVVALHRVQHHRLADALKDL